MEIYEERLRQKNTLILQLAEDLRKYQKIIIDQQNEIWKLNSELIVQGNGMKDGSVLSLWFTTGFNRSLLVIIYITGALYT